jgi:hypothetical protein
MHRMAAIGIGLVLAIGGGCGRAQRPTAPVSGVITYQGKPLDHGRVVFIHESGEATAADIGADGRYTMKAVVGHNALIVECRDLSGSLPRRGGGMFPASLIPERYGEHMRSGLSCDVKTENNIANFDLKP